MSLRINDAIALLKDAAVKLNCPEGEKALNYVVAALDEIWLDDRAAHRFFTSLEKTFVEGE